MEFTQRNNKWQWVIASIVLMIAFIHFPAKNMRALFEFMVVCASLLVFAIFLYENVNKWVAVFLLLALISHSLPAFLYTGKLNTMQSHLVLINITVGCLFYSVIVLKCQNCERIFDALCIVAMLHLYILFFEAFIVKWRFPTGLTANPNESSALMALCAPAFFRKGWLFFILIPVVGLILSKSFGGVVGLCLAFIIYAGLNGYKFWPPVLIFSGLIFYTLFIDAPDISRRLNIWTEAVKLSVHHKTYLLGIGLGRWTEIYQDVIKVKPIFKGIIRLHNTFIQNYIEMGIVSIFITVNFLISVILRARELTIRDFKIPRHCIISLSSLGAVIGVCIANSAFRMNAINGMLIILWLAILEVQLRVREVAD